MRATSFGFWMMLLVGAGCGGKAGSPATGPTGASTSTSGETSTANGSNGSSSSSSDPSSGTTTSSTGATGANPSSISGDLPDEAKAPSLAAKSDCPDKGGCYLKALVPDELKAKIDAKAPAFMWEEDLPRKALLSYPASADIDLYGILLDGEVSVMSPDIVPDKQKRLWKMNAFRAPGGGVTLVAKEPTRAILIVVAKKSGATVAQIVDATAKKPLPLQWAGSSRPSPVVSSELGAQPDLAWGGGAYHARIAFPTSDSDTSSASLGILIASKDAPVKEHTHDKEWELLAVLEGSGTLARAGANESIKAGAAVAVAPGTPHAWSPDGSAPLIAVQMYSPPGPEQRFKKLAADAK